MTKDQTGDNANNIGMLLSCLADLKKAGYYEKAIAIAKKILAIRKEAFGVCHADVAESLDFLGELYYLAGKYSEAEPILKESQFIRKNIFGSIHAETAKSYNHLGVLYSLIGEYSSSEKYLNDALKIFGTAFGPGHPGITEFMVNRAELYIKMDNRDEAEKILTMALAIQKKSLGPEDFDLVKTLNTFAWLEINNEEFEKSELFSRRALEIGEKNFGSEHPYIADSLKFLGRIYTSRGDNKTSISINERSLAMREKFLGFDHPDISSNLNDLALSHCNLKRYNIAKTLLTKSLFIMEKILGSNHQYLIEILQNLGWVHKTIGDYAGAVPYFKRSLEICEKVRGPEHIDLTWMQRDLAELYNLLDDYKNAEPLLNRALYLSKKKLGHYHPRVGTILGNLAFIYSSYGEYEKAVLFHKQSIEIDEKIYNGNPSNLVAGLVNLATLYMDMGEYEKSEELFVKALAYLKETSEPESPNIGTIYNNMGRLYDKLNDYNKAETAFYKSLAIYKNVFGPEHPNIAICLDNLAILYQGRGENKKAILLYKQALKIKENVFGKDHQMVATTLNNLAALYGLSGDPAKAFSLYNRVLKIKETTIGIDCVSYANTLMNLAWLHNVTGNFEKAEPIYRQAVGIWEKILGSKHPNVSNGFYHLSKLYTTLREYDKAYDYINMALGIDSKLIDDVMSFTSENQKLKFISDNNSSLHHLLNLTNHYFSKNNSKRKNAFDVWIKNKGMILEVQICFQRTLISSENTEVKILFEKLNDLRARISKITFNEALADRNICNEQKRSALEDEKEQLEAKLSRLSQQFKLKQKWEKVNSEEIAKTLPAKTALLEFSRIETLNLRPDEKESYGQNNRYIAFILHSEKGNKISMVDLGDADNIDNMIAQYKMVILKSENFDNEVVAKTACELYNLVFRPLVKDLGNVKEIFISPDGNLNLIPFEVLQAPDGRFLIEDYTFNYLASGRDIVRFDGKQDSGGKYLLMGNPDFDYSISDNNSLNFGIETKEQNDIDQLHRSANLNQITFAPLHHAEEELEAISEIVGKNRSEVYIGKQATEEVLLSKKNPEVFHIATHGFFLNDQDRPGTGRGWQTASLPGQSENSTNDFVRKINTENPLLRSGIFLSGARRSMLTGNTNKSDGIVTAEKILGLNLEGTRMVVLSACDTGLGEVKSGEGVYGLRRAFTQAGAKSLVISLWKVPDRETKELMVLFYRNIKSGKMNRCQALRQASLEQMEIVKRRYGYANPRYWGAFVFMGEP